MSYGTSWGQSAWWKGICDEGSTIHEIDHKQSSSTRELLTLSIIPSEKLLRCHLVPCQHLPPNWIHARCLACKFRGILHLEFPAAVTVNGARKDLGPHLAKSEPGPLQLCSTIPWNKTIKAKGARRNHTQWNLDCRLGSSPGQRWQILVDLNPTFMW